MPRSSRRRISWAKLVRIPAGFADGTDDVGYKSATQPTTYDIPPSDDDGFFWVYADVPLGVDVDLYIIPAVGGSLVSYPYVMQRGPLAADILSLPAVPADTIRRVHNVINYGSTAQTFKVRTRVYNTGIAPAAFKKAAKQVEVGVVKVSKREAKEMRQRFGW